LAAFTKAAKGFLKTKKPVLQKPKPLGKKLNKTP